MRYHPAKVPIHPEAFSRDLRGKRKRPRSHEQDHLKFIRALPCIICLTRNLIQAAHLRAGNPVYGKRTTGMSEKPGDEWTLPLCAAHHEEQHRGNEMAFWARYGISDPFALCLSLYKHSLDEDEEAAELVVKLARKR